MLEDAMQKILTWGKDVSNENFCEIFGDVYAYFVVYKYYLNMV